MKYLEVDGVGRVSRIGLGTWQFGSREWGYGDELRLGGRARHRADARSRIGVTLFDTAEVYGTGKSERILGEALGDERANVAVASKIFPVAPFPAVVKQRAHASARRLQLDRIPLYQVHQPNPVVPDSVIMPGMRDLLDDGSDRRGRRLQLLAGALAEGRRRPWPAGHQQPGALLAGPPQGPRRPGPVRRAREPHRDRLQPAGAGTARRQVRPRQPAARWRAGDEPLFGTENLRRVEPLLQTLRDVAAEVGRQACPGGTGVADQSAGCGRHPRSVQRGTARVQRRRRRSRAQRTESRDALTAAARAFKPVSASRFLIDLVREKVAHR